MGSTTEAGIWMVGISGTPKCPSSHFAPIYQSSWKIPVLTCNTFSNVFIHYKNSNIQWKKCKF
jgi:hypothetical protein